MIRAWGAKIPHLIVTDFDSLTVAAERAIIRGAKDAGYSLVGESSFLIKIDSALEKGPDEFSNVAASATSFFGSGGLNTFVFTSDLEYSLLTDANKTEVAKILNEVAASKTDYGTGYSIDDLRRLIGSKLAPFSPATEAKFKKPFIHRKIARTISLATAHPDIQRLLNAIEAL